MSYGRYQTAQLQTALGQAVAGAEVYILSQPANLTTLTPQAQVYADPLGNVPLTQPLYTDGFGQFVAYVAPGVYTVVYISEITGQLVYEDQNIAVGGGTPGSTTFDEIGSGTNTTAAMVVGSGASLAPSGTGRVKATDIDGVQVTGTPGTGQVLTATSPTQADWQTPASGGVVSLNSLSGVLTLAVGTGLTISQSGSTITINLSAPTTPLTISSFSGGGSYELGYSLVNPAFTASYSGGPATSANITNTDAIASPTTLTTPFTSGTVTGTFTHSTVTTTTFTLHASDGTNNPTATASATWNPRIFSGTGAAGGATGATASGTSAVLVGDTGTLPSFQLGAETVGTTFPFTGLTGQYVYMLLTGAGHTFIDANTGFPFAVTSLTITFTNQYGAAFSMTFYISINPLTGAFSPRVAT
jgi:hypothetical protein